VLQTLIKGGYAGADLADRIEPDAASSLSETIQTRAHTALRFHFSTQATTIRFV